MLASLFPSHPRFIPCHLIRSHSLPSHLSHPIPSEHITSATEQQNSKPRRGKSHVSKKTWWGWWACRKFQTLTLWNSQTSSRYPEQHETQVIKSVAYLRYNRQHVISLTWPSAKIKNKKKSKRLYHCTISHVFQRVTRRCPKQLVCLYWVFLYLPSHTGELLAGGNAI